MVLPPASCHVHYSEQGIEKPDIPKRGGGVIIYVNQKWAPYATEIDIGNNITKNYEAIALNVEKPNNRKMSLLCLYKLPTGSVEKVMDFLNFFMEIPVIVL